MMQRCCYIPIETCLEVCDPQKLWKAVALELAPGNDLYTLKDVMTTSEEEVAEELRRGCCCTGKCACTFRSQLTLVQGRILRRYKRLWRAKFGKEHGIFHLGDNPKKRCVWGKAIPTLRTNMAKLWDSSARRPLLRSEVQRSMGWGRKTQRVISKQMMGNAWHLAVGTAVTMVTLACIGNERLASIEHDSCEDLR